MKRKFFYTSSNSGQTGSKGVSNHFVHFRLTTYTDVKETDRIDNVKSEPAKGGKVVSTMSMRFSQSLSYNKAQSKADKLPNKLTERQKEPDRD